MRHKFHRLNVTRRQLRSRLAVLAAVAAAAAVGLNAPSVANAATTPTPPFAQCPAVGRSPSCAILLVAQTDGSITVYGDPSVSTYDGADDTLVGIANNSGAAIKAITVSGPGSGLAGLDGDGLCSFITCTWPAPTTYEGPLNTFTTASSKPDSAEVDFNGTGLASGQATYFSLEGALTSAVITARKGTLGGLRYVALGDSYSSGEGAFDANGVPSYIPTTALKGLNECHQSLNAYPETLSTTPGIDAIPVGYTFSACSGARVANFVKSLPKSGGWNQPAQLESLSSSTDLVTLSVGGNDAGFAPDLKACVHGFGAGFSGCFNQISNRLANGGSLLRDGGRVKYDFNNIDDWHLCPKCKTSDPSVVDVPSLHALYSQIHTRSPQAKIFVVGYPQLFPTGAKASCVVGTFDNQLGQHLQYKLEPSEMDALYNAEVVLNGIVKRNVQIAQGDGVPVTFVDTFSSFAGHGPCDSTAGAQWINGVVFQSHLNSGAAPESFHPNAQGQSKLAQLVLASL